MRFPGTCLTVCENSSVVAKHHVFDNRQSTLVVDLFLARILIVNVVESVGLTHFIWRWWLVVLGLV